MCVSVLWEHVCRDVLPCGSKIVRARGGKWADWIGPILITALFSSPLSSHLHLGFEAELRNNIIFTLIWYINVPTSWGFVHAVYSIVVIPFNISGSVRLLWGMLYFCCMFHILSGIEFTGFNSNFHAFLVSINSFTTDFPENWLHHGEHPYWSKIAYLHTMIEDFISCLIWVTVELGVRDLCPRLKQALCESCQSNLLRTKQSFRAGGLGLVPKEFWSIGGNVIRLIWSNY